MSPKNPADVLNDVINGTGEAKLPHAYDYPAIEGEITCKFCRNKVPFPLNPDQWENALWGSGKDLGGISRFMRWGCSERLKAKS
jgi:hypothetical protein